MFLLVTVLGGGFNWPLGVLFSLSLSLSLSLVLFIFSLVVGWLYVFFRTGVFFFLFYFRSGSPVVVGSRWPLLIWWLIVRLTPWPPSPRSFIARPRTLFMIRQILRRRPPTAGRGRPQKKACRRWQITPTFLLLLLLHLLLFRLVFLVFSRSLSLSLSFS